jgi:hypothetical protein
MREPPQTSNEWRRARTRQIHVTDEIALTVAERCHDKIPRSAVRELIVNVRCEI